MSIGMSPPATVAPDLAIARQQRGHSLWSDAWKRLRRNRAAVVSAVVLVVISAIVT